MTSGIYKISNKVNNACYIGSAVNIQRRFYEHKTNLRTGKHKNQILQRVYDKYGEQNLNFSVIEYVGDKENLIKIEQKYIDNLKPKYNICKIASSQLGLKRSNNTKSKISKALQGNHNNYGSKRTEESNNKISKYFKVISPNGEIYEGINLSKFCKIHNLHQSNMCQVLKGNLKQYKGWKKG